MNSINARDVAVVTGANGFVGTNLINALADRGWMVIAVSRSVPGTLTNTNDGRVSWVTWGPTRRSRYI